MKNEPFKHGEYVEIIPELQSNYSIKIGAVCGVWTITTSEVAHSFGCPIGTVMVTVEAAGGATQEIPYRALRQIPDKTNRPDVTGRSPVLRSGPGW